ncbi:OsmC family protein [Flagellimonas allohymeniacidonis]|uniref:OsmC family peroxiredoxin n=1 Tax=Flagellimonas allohymeniacidonis TaxID=2517819 RepID=A0A4Q8QGG5_9FLAO|nr:OsmC family protein [Allomuricauda hymeniacidonis]TAI49571.1 OsmC family peroxiredoxin [Allomuricauda hymeniacidonis]
MIDPSLINSIDLSEISRIIETITENPKAAQLRLGIKSQWRNSGHHAYICKIYQSSFYEDFEMAKLLYVNTRRPNMKLGRNEWSRPVKSVLENMAISITTTLLIHAASRGISLTKVGVIIEGELDMRGFLGLDDSIRSGYQDIAVQLEIDGALNQAQAKELKYLARKSPLFDMLKYGLGNRIRI